MGHSVRCCSDRWMMLASSLTLVIFCFSFAATVTDSQGKQFQFSSKVLLLYFNRINPSECHEHISSLNSLKCCSVTRVPLWSDLLFMLGNLTLQDQSQIRYMGSS